MSAQAEKVALRAEVLGRRVSVSARVRNDFAESLAVVGARLTRQLGPAPVAAVFHPFRQEADTLPLIRALADAKVATALPVTVTRAGPLRFLAWRPGDPLLRGRFGVSEPLPSAAELVPDVLFVPLAAFDGRGFRLGYGAGYYDSSLAALRRSKRVLAVGVAFSVQEVARVPTEPHDERLDAIVTEHGLLTFGPNPCASSSSAT